MTMMELGYIPLSQVLANVFDSFLVDTAKGRNVVPTAQVRRHFILIVNDLNGTIVGKATPISRLDGTGILDRALLVRSAAWEDTLGDGDVERTLPGLEVRRVSNGNIADALQMPISGALAAWNDDSVVGSRLGAFLAQDSLVRVVPNPEHLLAVIGSLLLTARECVSAFNTINASG